ncbi:MAG: ABC transporter substrate-binding protein [Acidimicrobiales bacterium]
MKRVAALLLSAAALISACGDDDGDVSSAATTAPPTDVPERIVSMSPTATEILFAIDAGDLVVAVDSNSDFPAEVEELPRDLSAFEPNVEAIADFEPDLVILSNDSPEGDTTAGLETLGIEVIVGEAATTLDDTYDQIAELGIATGHEDEAAELVSDMRDQIDELVASVPERSEPPTFFHELDDQLYSATSASFIGQIYDLAGLENIADEADPDNEFGGYPQLSPEFVVSADPDFIFLADAECCAQNAGTVAQRPGFAGISAVREGHVVPLDEDIASRWGPRVVDLLRVVIDATAEVPVG